MVMFTLGFISGSLIVAVAIVVSVIVARNDATLRKGKPQ